jgi:hypothetical protein
MEIPEQDMRLRIEAAEKTLRNNFEWVGRFDNKAAIVLGAATGMLGLFASFSPPIHSWSVGTAVVALLALFCVSTSLIFLYLATYPRTKRVQRSLFFWGSIAKTPYEEYADAFVQQTQEDYLHDLLQQCHRNGEILHLKFLYLKWAYRFLFGALLPWTLSIYLFRSLTMNP